MTLRFCDGPTLTRAVASAVATLSRHADEVDALNVFPVPDGDTGRNMLATMRAALEAARDVPPGDRTVERLADALARGSLLGARGNSGVILSQVLRGMAESARGKRRVDGLDLAHALARGSSAADAAVAHPVEGTILTVVRAAADAGRVAAERDPSVEGVLSEAVEAAARAVARTPDLLPILHDAGVVDAGGRGLELLLRGMLLGVAEGVDGSHAAAGSRGGRSLLADAEGGFGYETMFLVSAAGGSRLDVHAMREHLATLGDSVLVVGDEQVARVHVHSERPDLVLGYGLGLGTLSRVSVENMDLLAEGDRAERAAEGVGAGMADAAPGGASALHAPPGVGTGSHAASRTGEAPAVAPGPVSRGRPGVPIATATLHADHAAAARAAADRHDGQVPLPVTAPRVPVAIVAVVAGDGLARTFAAAGARVLASGGPGDHPSTGDLMRAIEEAGADLVVVLPNHPNVRLAAEQAGALVSGTRVEVVPTRNAVEGLAAVLALDPRDASGSGVERMRRAAREVRSFAVTHAVRDALIAGQRIRRGHALALDPDEALLATGPDRLDVAIEALGRVAVGTELLTIHYGAGVELDEAERLAGRARDALPGVAVEVLHGGQPFYPYLVVAE
jgi:hypothetical protein